MARHHAEKLLDIGNRITSAGMRVSMHPGQYTVLNSPIEAVVERAVQDLNYHAEVLDCLGLGPEHKLVLHVGGVYGDKIRRKVDSYPTIGRCNPRSKQTGDGALFDIMDVLEIAASVDSPVVYDNLHNATNPADRDRADFDWIRLCSDTWRRRDGLQKIHYSQQHSEKKPGAHSASIHIDTFLEFYRQLLGMDIDIMLEVKDKNISALKCINCVSSRGNGELVAEWARYEYLVLERSP